MSRKYSGRALFFAVALFLTFAESARAEDVLPATPPPVAPDAPLTDTKRDGKEGPGPATAQTTEHEKAPTPASGETSSPAAPAPKTSSAESQHAESGKISAAAAPATEPAETHAGQTKKLKGAASDQATPNESEKTLTLPYASGSPGSESSFISALGLSREGGHYSFDRAAVRPRLLNTLVMHGVSVDARVLLYRRSKCGARPFQLVEVRDGGASHFVSFDCDGRCYGTKESTGSGVESEMSRPLTLPREVCEALWGGVTELEDKHGL